MYDPVQCLATFPDTPDGHCNSAHEKTPEQACADYRAACQSNYGHDGCGCGSCQTGCQECSCEYNVGGYWGTYTNCQEGGGLTYGPFTCYDDLIFRAHGSCPPPSPPSLSRMSFCVTEEHGVLSIADCSVTSSRSAGASNGCVFGCADPSMAQNLPGIAQYGKGFSIVTGRPTGQALLAGASFNQGALFEYSGKCYKIPDMLANVTTCVLGVNFDDQTAQTGFSSLSGKDTVSFQHNWGTHSNDDFSLGASGYGAALSAAYTDSEEMSHVRESSESQRKSVVMLTKDYSFYTADPQSSIFTPGPIREWKRLMATGAPYSSSDAAMPTWQAYFDIPTERT